MGRVSADTNHFFFLAYLIYCPSDALACFVYFYSRNGPPPSLCQCQRHRNKHRDNEISGGLGGGGAGEGEGETHAKKEEKKMKKKKEEEPREEAEENRTEIPSRLLFIHSCRVVVDLLERRYETTEINRRLEASLCGK